MPSFPNSHEPRVERATRRAGRGANGTTAQAEPDPARGGGPTKNETAPAGGHPQPFLLRFFYGAF